MINPLALERAERGHKLLLEKKGEGYWEQINTNTLRMGTCTHCVLAQLYGTYRSGVDRTGISIWNTVYYGFDTSVGDKITVFELGVAWIYVWEQEDLEKEKAK